VSFSLIFVMTGAIMTKVYGYEFLDPTKKYQDPIDQMAAQMSFACLEEQTDNKVVLNNKGIEGMVIAEMTGMNFCDAVVEGLLKSGEGWYVDSVTLDEDGEHVEKVLKK